MSKINYLQDKNRTLFRGGAGYTGVLMITATMILRICKVITWYDHSK